MLGIILLRGERFTEQSPEADQEDVVEEEANCAHDVHDEESLGIVGNAELCCLS